MKVFPRQYLANEELSVRLTSNAKQRSVALAVKTDSDCKLANFENDIKQIVIRDPDRYRMPRSIIRFQSECLVAKNGDDKFCRANMLATVDTRAIVELLDHGDVIIVDFDDVYRLPKEARSEPARILKLWFEEEVSLPEGSILIIRLIDGMDDDEVYKAEILETIDCENNTV